MSGKERLFCLQSLKNEPAGARGLAKRTKPTDGSNDMADWFDLFYFSLKVLLLL